MILTQVTLLVKVTSKKANGAETETITPIALPATKERIYQSRLDQNSMIGLGKQNRYKLNGVGEYETELRFDYFLDEKQEKYKVTTWERNPKNNEMTLEGVVANGI